VLLDQAGWHGAKALNVLGNISLMPLPPRDRAVKTRLHCVVLVIEIKWRT
jgi:hypothetical protein